MLVNTVIFLPLVAGLVVLALPRIATAALKTVALAGSTITFLLSLAFLPLGVNVSAQFSAPWINAGWTAVYHVRVDALSLFFVLLTTLASALCIWAAFSYRDLQRLRGFLFLLLAFETTLLGLFTAADLLLFYVYWDLMLIPVFLLLAGYAGSAEARRAAWYYLIYNGAGGLVLLLGIVALVSQTHSFDVLSLSGVRLNATLEWWLFAAFALAFLIKTPAFPFHSWMPPTYTQAPAPLVALVSGVQSKAGLYALIAFALPLFPNAAHKWAPVLLLLAICSIIYGALASLGQRDMKTLVAFSSLSHLGLVWLALFAFDLTSVSAGILMLISHGVIATLLFLLLGFVEERVGTRDLAAFGGLAQAAPRLQALLLVATMAALGLPGLSGFAGEYLILIGSWQTQPAFTAVALLAVILSAAYMLVLFQGILHGPLRAGSAAPGTALELRPREIAIAAPLIVLVFFLGMWPAWLNDRTPVAPAAVTVSTRGGHA